MVNLKEILSRVQRLVQSNGGNFELVGFRKGVVTVRLKGSCVGCPVSILSLEGDLKTILKSEIPEIEKVELVI